MISILKKLHRILCYQLLPNFFYHSHQHVQTFTYPCLPQFIVRRPTKYLGEPVELWANITAKFCRFGLLLGKICTVQRYYFPLKGLSFNPLLEHIFLLSHRPPHQLINSLPLLIAHEP